MPKWRGGLPKASRRRPARPARPGANLPEEDARALTEACRPGLEALGEAGIEYQF